MHNVKGWASNKLTAMSIIKEGSLVQVENLILQIISSNADGTYNLGRGASTPSPETVYKNMQSGSFRLLDQLALEQLNLYFKSKNDGKSYRIVEVLTMSGITGYLKLFYKIWDEPIVAGAYKGRGQY